MSNTTTDVVVVRPGQTIRVESAAEATSQPPVAEQVRIPTPAREGKEHAIKTQRGSTYPLVRVRWNGTLYGVFWSGINPADHEYPGHRVGLKRLTQKSGYTQMSRNRRYDRSHFVAVSEVEVV